MSEDVSIVVLATGTELLTGELSDTNTAAIAAALAVEGLAVRMSLTVGDQLAEIREALRYLAASHQAVIVTGGLGPTADDLTAAAAAAACDLELQHNPEAAELISAHFRRINREMHNGNLQQARLPQGCTILPNHRGTAPGFRLRLNRAELFFLPGVPDEMLAMLDDQVLPRLLKLTGRRPARHEVRLQIFGLAEPHLEELLGAIELPSGIEIGFGVSFPRVIIKLRGLDPLDLDLARQRITAALQDCLVIAGDTSFEERVAELLIQSGQTLALAESCTGGLIAARLTEVPGASAFLERSAVTYANSAKQDWLGVPETILLTDGAVSAACAEAMARGIRSAAGTDFGLAVTGIAGPGGGTPEKPVGTVFLALADQDGVTVERLELGGSRQRIRELTLATALDRLIRHLQQPAKKG